MFSPFEDGGCRLRHVNATSFVGTGSIFQPSSLRWEGPYGWTEAEWLD